MRLAKPHLDLGMFTADIDDHRRFWGEDIGLRLDHELPFDALWVQHRYDAHGSVIKVNHYRHPMPDVAPSGLAGLTIAREGVSPREARTPGGEWVRLVTPGTNGVVRIGITVRTPEPQRLLDFYLGVLEFEAAGPMTARCGDSLLFVEKGPGGTLTPDFMGPGFRYLTIQIFDADAETAACVARGARLGRAPVNFGTIARYGFVLDPDGNWIELSARASLTGVAPPT